MLKRFNDLYQCLNVYEMGENIELVFAFPHEFHKIIWASLQLTNIVIERNRLSLHLGAWSQVDNFVWTHITDAKGREWWSMDKACIVIHCDRIICNE